jgi:hypothetical protein
VVEEPLLGTMAAEIQAAIPGAQVRLYSCGEAFGYGSRACGTERPDSHLGRPEEISQLFAGFQRYFPSPLPFRAHGLFVALHQPLHSKLEQ